MNKEYSTAAIFKSLGDETRLSIVRKLARENCEVNSREIVLDRAIALKLSQPTMSHHFHTLVLAGVLLERKVGVEKHYSLNAEALRSIGLDAQRI